MGNRKLTVLPPREIFFDQVPDDEPKFATFKAKWDDAYRKKWGIQNGPARELPAGVEEKLARLARKVYRVLKIQGFGRIDVRLTHGRRDRDHRGQPQSVAGPRGRLRPSRPPPPVSTTTP